jgi:hypothetical protein
MFARDMFSELRVKIRTFSIPSSRIETMLGIMLKLMIEVQSNMILV